MKVLFLHDTSLSLLRGAELTIKQLMALGTKRGFLVDSDGLRDFEVTRQKLGWADLTVVNSTSRCSYEKELIPYLLANKIRYVKVEYDYNFCIRRNILCTVDRKYRLCCDADKFHLFRELFAGSLMNFFKSPKHYQNYVDFYGEAVRNHILMPPTVDVDAIRDYADKNENVIPFFGELSYLKGGEAYLEYALSHPEKRFEVYGQNKINRPVPDNVSFKDPIPNQDVLEILGRTKYFFCKPVWPEPSGRLAAEAFLSGCEIIANDRIGTFSFDFYPHDRERARDEMKKTPDRFWDALEALTDGMSPPLQKRYQNVLIYKSYGGLGDIFFCIPSLYVMARVSHKVSFAVAPRLVSFFQKHLQGIDVVDETQMGEREHEFDKVIELGNYPAFRGYDLPHAIRYSTHKKVKQHAIGHYVDAVSKFHIGAPTRHRKFPYFERQPDFQNPYYTLHPGAGFLLKIWPTSNYAQVIAQIHEAFPTLRCKIILGPSDPNPIDYMPTRPSYVDLVTGGMDEVGNAMQGALFHIGNDAGITHVAGAFNVPTVGIYGPTGPGSWGSFSQQSEIVWGKSGNCNLKCNYDVIINCADRVCLSSITSTKVMGALYKLLQKTYPERATKWIVNPGLTSDITDSDCLMTLDKNEFLVNFTSPAVRDNVQRMLAGNLETGDEDMLQFRQFLQEQNLAFCVPEFN